MSENENKYRLPHNKSLEHATQIAIRDDKPIMLDYWAESLDNSILIGVRDSGEKLLVKNEDVAHDFNCICPFYLKSGENEFTIWNKK